jgi:ribosomal protein RSM22 (predicted rRNA methylase)
MHLPRPLREAIEEQLTGHSLNHLAKAAEELSETYRHRSPMSERFASSAEKRLAYLAVRMPATYAAAQAVLKMICEQMPQLRVSSLLDLGAGPGTTAWAAAEIFPELQRVTQLEDDAEMIDLGKSLTKHSENRVLKSAVWQRADFRTITEFPAHDLVMCAYALNEIDEAGARRVLRAAWQSAEKVLVLVEPGTMAGFSLIRKLRDELISMSAHLVAPCPQANACPMQEPDWCHFAQRFERSALHRRLKNAALSYEDEKFSYLVAAKPSAGAAQPVTARVLRHPQIQSGFIQLQLCTRNGLSKIAVRRKDKEAWKRARKTDWGDAWE